MKPTKLPPIHYVSRPATSFPFRDLLVLEQCRLDPDFKVCEIGVGTGATAVRLSRLCSHVTGLDVSAPAIGALRDIAATIANLDLRVADITQADSYKDLDGSFGAVVSCDTLEHVSDPAAYASGIARILAPNGAFLVTFPNEPREVMHGITRFDTEHDLVAHYQRAGLSNCRAGSARLSAHAERVAHYLGRLPLRAVRAVVRHRSKSTAPAQVFDETAFHRQRRLWERLAPAVNLYWFSVLRLMTARGPAFKVDWGFRETEFQDCRVVVTGRRLGEGGTS